MQLYCISIDENNNLTVPTASLRKNIKSYLSLYVRTNQGIDILDGRIINVGVEYSVVVAPGLNKTKVKFETLKKIKEYFNINNWQLNQAIILDDIRQLIKETDGIISIANLEIKNKSNNIDSRTYSSYSYDILGSTRNGIIFCDPKSIFEVKYPDIDIKVSAI